MRGSCLAWFMALVACGARSELDSANMRDATVGDAQDASAPRTARDYVGSYIGIITTEVLWTDPDDRGVRGGEFFDRVFMIRALSDEQIELRYAFRQLDTRLPDGGLDANCAWTAHLVGDHAVFDRGARCRYVPPPGVTELGTDRTVSDGGEIRLTGRTLTFHRVDHTIFLTAMPFVGGLDVNYIGDRF